MEQVRISKILSELGLCSRREADEYIKQGQVLLDGKVVNELGTKAYRSQKVELNKKGKLKQSKKLTILLNKPVGYISHLDDDKEFIWIDPNAGDMYYIGETLLGEVNWEFTLENV